jgi:hypothetical protein
MYSILTFSSRGIRMSDISTVAKMYNRQLQAMQEHPWRNMAGIRRMKRKVQAIQETQRDITTTYAARRISGDTQVDKNNYKSYEAQVNASYKMYDGLADYGSEVLSSVADIRVAFLAGEGISLFSENKKKVKFLNEFLKHNNLGGSKLLSAALMGELEGKVLFVLALNKEKKTIDARLFSWHINKYTIKRDAADYEKITSITYLPEGTQKEKVIDIEKSIYLKLGGSNYKDDAATTKIGKVLTQCENASRAAFDLRKNTHLFGKIFPYWHTQTGPDAKAINDAVAAKSFEIGDGYAGAAQMSLLEPSGSAAEAVIKDMLNSMRFIASMTGVPIHWLAWPELMSNRATAENLLEVVSAATKKERLIWEESLTSLFEKVCQMAVDGGVADANILDKDVTVKLPLISMTSLQQLVDIWTLLWKDKLISDFTMRSMIPGIDPVKEEELVKKAQEEEAANSPFVNTAADAFAKNMQNPPPVSAPNNMPMMKGQPNG